MKTLSKTSPEISSPCIQVCSIDRTTRICRGCFRTLDQIVAWPKLEEAERQRIMREELPQQQKEFSRGISKSERI